MHMTWGRPSGWADVSPQLTSERVASTAYHVLVVDADCAARTSLTQDLRREDWRVTTATEFRDVKLALAGGDTVDLVILEIGRCRAEGFSLINELHRLTDAAVLLLVEPEDGVGGICGLEMGADDCVRHDVALRELRARMRNLITRTQVLRQARQPMAGAGGEELRFGDWRLETEQRRLVTAGGHGIKLTNAEQSLLLAFLGNPGRVLGREWLLEQISQRGLSSASRSVDVAVAQLRRKLGDDSRNPTLIVTVHGIGYRFCGAPLRQSAAR